MKSATQILQDLIRIPSVNPDGDPGSDDTGEKPCALWVADFLESIGAQVTMEEILPDRPNVIGRFDSKSKSSEGPRLLFAPHLDTVSVKGMTIDPFGGEIRDGKILGRGASDTKGTMAAMLWAFQELKDDLPKLNASISFVGLMGEETGQPGSQHFAKHHGDEFDFAIVGEPTELDVVYTHKGCVWIEVSCKGKAVHGSTPELGDNAILKLTPVLADLLPMLERSFADHEDPVLGKPTINLGQIHGGSRTNIVPDFATAALDIRETPSLRAAGGGLQLVKNFLKENDLEDSVSFEVVVDSSPLSTDPKLDPIQRFQTMGSQLVSAPWFCDAGWLAKGGIAAIACGPGSIAQAHTKDEFLKVDDLEAGARYYKQFLETYR